MMYTRIPYTFVYLHSCGHSWYTERYMQLVHIKLQDDQIGLLDAYCEKTGATRTGAIRKAINDAFGPVTEPEWKPRLRAKVQAVRERGKQKR
jgi:hypothetical protein